MNGELDEQEVVKPGSHFRQGRKCAIAGCGNPVGDGAKGRLCRAHANQFRAFAARVKKAAAQARACTLEPPIGL